MVEYTSVYTLSYGTEHFLMQLLNDDIVYNKVITILLH